MQIINARYSLRELWDEVTFLTIIIFALYTIWYQDTHGTISGAFIALGLVFLVLILLNLKRLSYFKELYAFVAYTLVISLETLFFSRYKSASIQMLIQHFKYMLPMLAMFLYMDGKREKINKILWVCWFSVLLLSLGSFLHPSIRRTGAVSVGTLNSNTFSSYQTLGLLSAITLMYQKKTTKLERLVLLCGIVVDAIAQINAASRRGFIIYLFIICFTIWETIRIKFKRKPFSRITLILFVGVIISLLGALYLEKFANTPMVERLLGKANTESGDLLREKYQAVAWELFLSDPLFGTGLNSVGQVVGVYSHSMYFELLGCTGIFGTIPILFLFVENLIYFGISLAKKDNGQCNELSFMSMNGFLFCISVLLTGYAVVYIYDMLFYILVPILTAIRKSVEAPERQYLNTNS